jgi:phosphonate transport system substrate-binding protein
MAPTPRKLNAILFLLAFLSIFWGYSKTANADEAAGESTKPIVRIGLLPDSSPEILHFRFDPLKTYLEKAIGQPIELVIPVDYGELLNLFGNKTIDIAFFGGYTFVKAQKLYNAEPLAMRDIDLKFTSLFITQANNPNQSLADFKGARLSFGAKMSTSGHYMPRYFLQKLGFVPENYFSSVNYSGGHDKTAFAIRDGEADLGAANSDVIRAMLKDGRLSGDKIRIVWETPFFSDYVFAVHPDLPSDLKSAMLDALLALSISDPEQSFILSSLNAQSFLPANKKDFDVLENIIQSLEQGEDNETKH